MVVLFGGVYGTHRTWSLVGRKRITLMWALRAYRLTPLTVGSLCFLCVVGDGLSLASGTCCRALPDIMDFSSGTVSPSL